jgi:hypothetical protein
MDASVAPVVDAAVPVTGNLGAACTQDSDCGGGGITCTLPTANDPVFGGGPANGYCTKSCTKDGDCGASGACLTDPTGGMGRCVLTCTQGPALMHINDPIMDNSKCLARPDVACEQLSMTQSACVPLCGSDSQCPNGMHCDPRAAVCVQAANPGLANGKTCDPNPDGGAPACAGQCLTIGLGSSPDAGTASVCSQGCVLGVDPLTMNLPTKWTACGGIQNGLCSYLASGVGAGDEGACTNACSKQDDCNNPNFFCFGIRGITGANGITNGWCFSATRCPNGNADCTANGFPGSTCAQTAYGPECISTQFPLGSAAPPSDGGVTDGG